MARRKSLGRIEDDDWAWGFVVLGWAALARWRSSRSRRAFWPARMALLAGLLLTRLPLLESQLGGIGVEHKLASRTPRSTAVSSCTHTSTTVSWISPGAEPGRVRSRAKCQLGRGPVQAAAHLPESCQHQCWSRRRSWWVWEVENNNKRRVSSPARI